MCKMGRTALETLDSRNETPEDKHWFFYSPMGNSDNMITEDCYGAVLKPVPIDHVINALKIDIATQDYYRRHHWALKLLTAMREDAHGEFLTVLIYGY